MQWTVNCLPSSNVGHELGSLSFAMKTGVVSSWGHGSGVHGQVQQTHHHQRHINVVLPEMKASSHQLSSRAAKRGIQIGAVGRSLKEDTLQGLGCQSSNGWLHNFQIQARCTICWKLTLQAVTQVRSLKVHHEWQSQETINVTLHSVNHLYSNKTEIPSSSPNAQTCQCLFVYLFVTWRSRIFLLDFSLVRGGGSLD